MWKLTRRGLWNHKRRLISTSLAVVLGVAFLTATLTLGDTMRGGIDQLLEHGNAETDVIVRNATKYGSDEMVERGRLDGGLVAELTQLDGVAVAAPSIEGFAQIEASDGDPIGGNGPPTLAGNWIDDPRLNPFQVVDGRAPAADGEVVIDRRSARLGDLQVGDHTTLRTPDPLDVEIVGIAKFGSVDSIAGASFVAFTTDQARDVLVGGADEVSSILVMGDDGISPEQLRSAVASALPSEAEALTGDEIIAETQDDIEADFLGFFETFLLMFAGVALLVATFSIHNTFSILVAQRTRESALVRAIGASRGQVLRSICSEALAIGVVASGIGLGAGVGLGYGFRALIESFGVELPNAGLVVTTSTIVAALVVGVVVTFLASVTPAIKGSRVAPLAALRENAIDRSGASKWRAAFGALALGGGIALTITAVTNSEGALGRAGLGALATLVGAVALGPVVARPASALLGSPLAAFAGSGRLARRNAMRNPRRTSGSASALMVGTAVVALFTTVGASIKASVGDVVEQAFSGDLVIVDESFSGAGLSPNLGGELAALPEVANTATMTNAVVSIDGEDAFPTVVDPDRLASVFDFEESSGKVAELQSGQIAVSDVYAADHALTSGSTLTFDYADGASQAVTVDAVYRGGEIAGDMVMTRADWTPHATRPTDVAVLIDLADGVSLDAGQAAVQAVADRLSAPEPQTSEEYIDSVGADVDQMLALVYGLLGLAVLIALMGIANTLSLSIHERTRELGLLRAVGQTRRQLRSTVRWEAVIVAIFGTIGGLGLGTFLGWGLIEAIAAQEGFGSFALPVVPLAAILALAAAAGVVAAVRPARRAAKLDILSAIATD